MPRRNFDAEMSAALSRLRSWAWLSELRAELTMTQAHQSLGIPSEERGPLYEVLWDGSSPAKKRIKGRLLLEVAHEAGIGVSAAKTYDHPIFRVLSGSTSREEVDVWIDKELEKVGLQILTYKDACTAEELSISGIAWIEEDVLQPFSCQDEMSLRLDSLGEWSALLIVLEMARRSYHWDMFIHDYTKRFWRGRLAASLKAASRILLVDEARHILQVHCDRFERSATPDFRDHSETHYSNASPNAWGSDNVAWDFSENKRRIAARLQWAAKIASARFQPPAILTKRNLAVAYLRNHGDLLRAHMTNALWEHAGCDTHALPSLPRFPASAAMRLQREWSTGRMCAACGEQYCDPYGPLREELKRNAAPENEVNEKVTACV